MLSDKKIAQCPVCPKGENFLGYIVKGEVCSYLCNDCQFLYTWDTHGKLMPPLKYKADKKMKRYCGPEGCHCH